MIDFDDVFDSISDLFQRNFIHYDVDEFIKMALKEQDEKHMWIQYCKILIDNEGKVIIINPSHQQTLMQIYKKEFNITERELWELIPTWYNPTEWIANKLKYLVVWYDFQLWHCKEKLNEQQKITLKKLEEANLIKIDLRRDITGDGQSKMNIDE